MEIDPHSHRFWAEIAYVALEHGLGKTRHGSLMGLVWFLLCAIFNRKPKPPTEKKETSA